MIQVEMCVDGLLSAYSDDEESSVETDMMALKGGGRPRSLSDDVPPTPSPVPQHPRTNRAYREHSASRRKRRSFKVGVAVLMKQKTDVTIPEDVLRRCQRMHRKVAVAPFDVVVRNTTLKMSESEIGPDQLFRELERISISNSEGLRLSESVPMPCSSPASPRSVPNSPTASKRLMWYDPSELPYLVRMKLFGERDGCNNWNPHDRHEQIALSHANHCATMTTSNLYRSVRAVTPIPLQKPVYFEMTFLDQRELGGICIGISSESFPLSACIGTRPDSFGLYSNGDTVCGNRWERYGPHIWVGDTIGCLVQLVPDGDNILGSITFYINGKCVGPTNTNILFSSHRVFPTLSLYSVGTRVACHFAPCDIKYGESLQEEVFCLNGQSLTNWLQTSQNTAIEIPMQRSDIPPSTPIYDSSRYYSSYSVQSSYSINTMSEGPRCYF
eukprot:CAMPEP_0184646742 /NCGR_PEP_ID=MMETSP0308-20130426/3502_1 /TAXON_ID=38269 /ORGANISM="Gloeochaete witrockiana, Strain SAG 46.84" /LENGTH=441 /DNA_ID=CAMNT_0027077041 /DNA_START=431 /DNA_END=1756 /DNA_ORIENTATION=+